MVRCRPQQWRRRFWLCSKSEKEIRQKIYDPESAVAFGVAWFLFASAWECSSEVYALQIVVAVVPLRCITLAAILSKAIVSGRGQISKRRVSFIGTLCYNIHYYNARKYLILYKGKNIF